MSVAIGLNTQTHDPIGNLKKAFFANRPKSNHVIPFSSDEAQARCSGLYSIDPEGFVYDHELNKRFIDAIYKKKLKAENAVLLPCGHIIQHSFFENWIKTSHQCPVGCTDTNFVYFPPNAGRFEILTVALNAQYQQFSIDHPNIVNVAKRIIDATHFQFVNLGKLFLYALIQLIFIAAPNIALSYFRKSHSPIFLAGMCMISKPVSVMLRNIIAIAVTRIPILDIPLIGRPLSSQDPRYSSWSKIKQAEWSLVSIGTVLASWHFHIAARNIGMSESTINSVIAVGLLTLFSQYPEHAFKRPETSR